MHLNEYQEMSKSTDQQPLGETPELNSSAILVPLLGIVGEVGELAAEYKKWLRDGQVHSLFPDRVREELGDLLWYVANTATKLGLSLEEIGCHNLRKTADRWPIEGDQSLGSRLLDEYHPPKERLPRRMAVTLNEGGSRVVRMYIDGTQVGDDLRDNRYEDDGYRFHDVFHLAYASILGWSPVLRALLKRKRKSDPAVDEVEDGGRAQVIEEGIAAMVFSYAERQYFLEGTHGVSFEVLRTIKDMTAHLEVSCRAEGEWERAILEGFRIWRQVRALGEGRLEANLELGTIELATG